MFRIKRLYTFVLESFLPVFFMTLMISNFILVMQMLWKYSDQIIGKGIEFSIFMQFYGYASLSLIPMSLPLAVLLASLMTFGNFGEQLELLAMKAAGISLFHIMKPLIVLMIAISIGAFYFQDKVMPVVQVKLMTLLASFKQKSPELSIPEGAFYSDVPGVTIYVKEKDVERNRMKDIMIYDFSKGYDNASVTVAKWGKLQFTDDKKDLVFTLHQGKYFSNLNNQQSLSAGIPYQRQSFRERKMIYAYDGNFVMVDSSNFTKSHIGMNTKMLNVIIDSLGNTLDSLAKKNAESYTKTQYLGRKKEPGHILVEAKDITKRSLVKPFYPNVDSLLQALDENALTLAIERTQRHVGIIRSEMEYKDMSVQAEEYQFRRSSIEFHRKFTLSFACLIFFFIGAPLGAIIRKGGLGMPAVVSVFLFIFYYMIDVTGYKFARDGVWNPILGGWISSAALLPLGVFLTYKSVNDSAILNGEAYIMFFKKYLYPRYLIRYTKHKYHKFKNRKK